MKINELKAKMGNVDIIIDIIDIAPPREFQKFGKPGRVANAIAKDETGDVKLTLWNDDIEKVKAGDKVHLTNGYVGEWQGELQLGTGKMGKMEIVGKADNHPQKKEEPSSSEPEQDMSVEEEDIEDLSGDDEEI